MGSIEVADGNAVLGMRLHSAAAAIRDRIGGGPPSATMLLGDAESEARAAIGDAEVDAAIAIGRRLEADAAIRLALGVE